jgi:hypothetical protein
LMTKPMVRESLSTRAETGTETSFVYLSFTLQQLRRRVVRR